MNIKILTKLNDIMRENPKLAFDSATLTQVINGVFDIDLDVLPTTDTVELSKHIDNIILNNYFSKIWQPETKRYKYSGLTLIDEINDMKPRDVIDIGCGYNEFKGKIHNLIGIDAYNDKADIKVPLMDFNPAHKYDVAICLGSINFGSTEKILGELNKVIGMMEQGGLLYFRVNPGIQHERAESRWINFYDWDPVFISNVAKTFNCELLTLRQDSNNRFYFVLKK